MEDYSERTGFEAHVTGANHVITFVLSAHLWLEHLLIQSLRAVVPNPDAMFRDRGMPFPTLVALAEAHSVLEADFADVLRRVNALRNKFAHRLAFEPTDNEIADLLTALRDMKAPFHLSYVPASEREMALALSSICGFLERRARELGAADLDPA
jgi:hypothetical protein